MFYRSIVFNQKGNSFLTATGNNKIILLDMNSLKKKKNYQDHTDAVNSIAFNNDESCIISSSDDGTCVIWDVETGIIIDKFQVGSKNSVF
jgi:WD40 repeat protein